MTCGVDESHDHNLRSWVTSANTPETDFPIQNLPFGVFSRTAELPRIGVAIGDHVLDAERATAAGVFADLPVEIREALAQRSLNRLMALGHDAMRVLRQHLIQVLREGSTVSDPGLLATRAEVRLYVPSLIGDFTDFYASLHHATRVGRLFRPDTPLLPNYKHLPVAYHGRASSLVPTGTAIRRPWGQTKASDDTAPVFRPTRSLDYELEAGIFIGRGTTLGQPILIADAEDHVFGLCLLNDWSARDIQAWEYQPLGPFLAKSFATTISPWVVTLEALAPFRTSLQSRPAGDPEPLPYLASTPSGSSAFDIHLEVTLSSDIMRARSITPCVLGRATLRDLYWDVAQMVAHHTSNGCNLRPGDLFGTGTVSGPDDTQRGCLLEMTANGREPIELPTGESRRYLVDGDEVLFRGYCEREGYARIGFGECGGVVLAALPARS
jgi:fumarylacetoacetase